MERHARNCVCDRRSLGRADRCRHLHAPRRAQHTPRAAARSLGVRSGCRPLAQAPLCAPACRIDCLRRLSACIDRTDQTERRSHHKYRFTCHADCRTMNPSLTILELAVLVLGLGLLLVDLWTAPELKRFLGYGAAIALVLVLVFSFLRFDGNETLYAFGGSYVMDGMALFFKRFFIV